VRQPAVDIRTGGELKGEQGSAGWLGGGGIHNTQSETPAQKKNEMK